MQPIRRDAGVHAFVLVYALAAFCVSQAAHVPGKFVPLTYAAYCLPIFVAAVVIGAGVWALQSGEPFAALRRAAIAARQPDHLAAFALIACLLFHMGVFTSVKTMLPDVVPFFADPLADLDEAVHGAAPWTYTTRLLPASWTTFACVLYYGVWGLLLPACLLAIVFSPQLRAQRSRYLWTYLIIWPLLGNVIAGALMSAGPVFYAHVTGDAERFAGLGAFLAQALPQEALEGMRRLWLAYQTSQPVPAAGISAFPSLHLANATMFVLLSWSLGRWLRVAAVAFCAITLVLSVHLGWHYAVDGYFSIAATLLVWHLVGRGQGVLTRHLWHGERGQRAGKANSLMPR
jgi:hypothetical protein